MTEPLITKDQLELAFGELATRLARRGTTATVFIFGGAAMMLAFDARAATRDVDAVFQPHGIVLEEAWAVAAHLGLPRYWLNDQGSSYLARRYDESATPVWQHTNLRVLAIGAEQLLAMKALASRRYADLDDIRFLADHVGITSVAEIDALIADIFPDQSLSERARLVIEDLLEADR